MFAIADGGQCRSSANAADIYAENSMSSACSSIENGKGGLGSSNVYFATGEYQTKADH